MDAEIAVRCSGLPAIVVRRDERAWVMDGRPSRTLGGQFGRAPDQRDQGGVSLAKGYIVPSVRRPPTRLISVLEILAVISPAPTGHTQLQRCGPTTRFERPPVLRSDYGEGANRSVTISSATKIGAIPRARAPSSTVVVVVPMRSTERCACSSS
jgi:hypothetical protein